MSLKKNKVWILISILILLILVVVFYYMLTSLSSVNYDTNNLVVNSSTNVVPNKNKIIANSPINSTPLIPIPVTHIKTPASVKALYISSWVAGLPKFRNYIIKMIDDTELNAVVIDIKDATGRVSFEVNDPLIISLGSPEKRIKDIGELLQELHSKNIYVIGRISVFQDPYLTAKKPEWAITKKSDGTIWKDHKGLSFLDPAKKDVWNYVESIAKDSYAIGFDEINFDYIRYPSDGNIKDINYHIEAGRTRADNMEAFFMALSKEVKKDNNIPMSADLFGLTTESTDDMGIGQVWEKAMPYFDYIAPMVYPSHYPSGQDGFKNPAEHPYEIITKALQGAIKKTNTMIPEQSINKIRPWLQDFNLGATYTAPMIKAEMKAVYDQKLTSWMLWDPKNIYTPSALEIAQ